MERSRKCQFPFTTHRFVSSKQFNRILQKQGLKFRLGTKVISGSVSGSGDNKVVKVVVQSVGKEAHQETVGVFGGGSNLL